MASEDYGDSFSVCFNMMKMKYQTYDKELDESNFLSPTDKVNVFINFETVLKYLSQIKDIDKKIVLEREFPQIMISNILNLAAHYKRFFAQNGLKTRVFLYYTDLKSDSYTVDEYNDEYRSYYTQKFIYNPKYSMLGDYLTETIIPEVKTISEFINGVYFITAKGFDSSLVPQIVADLDPSYKNIIISGDDYDTQYQFNTDSFLMHFIKRGTMTTNISYDMEKTARLLFFDKDDDCDGLVKLMCKNLSFYDLLLCSKGSKCRSIDGVKGIGYKTIVKYILNGLDSGKIDTSTSNIDLILSTFPDESVDRLRNNMECINIATQRKKLRKDTIYDVEKQIVDRFDNNSLVKLNAGKFFHHQLMLQELTM